MNRPGVEFRLYGQIRLRDPEALASLGDLLPSQAGKIQDNLLEIDYEGWTVDLEPFLAMAAQVMQAGDEGHVDVFDDQAGLFTRAELAPGGHDLKTYRYDDILEHTKREGNW